MREARWIRVVEEGERGVRAVAGDARRRGTPDAIAPGCPGPAGAGDGVDPGEVSVEERLELLEGAP